MCAVPHVGVESFMIAPRDIFYSKYNRVQQSWPGRWVHTRQRVRQMFWRPLLVRAISRFGSVLDEILSQEHKIDGKIVDVKRAVPKSEAPGPSSR